MATVYVSFASGNDANTYVQAQSRATPWKTIGQCNTGATTGDIIVVLAGTHTMAAVTFTKNFTIQGDTSDATLYIFSGGAGSFQWQFAGQTVTVKWLTFTNFVLLNLTAILAVQTNGNLTVTSCIFYNISGRDSNGGGQCGVISGGLNKSNGFITVTGCAFYQIKRTNAETFPMIGVNGGTTWVTVITNCIFHSNEVAMPLIHMILVTNPTTSTLTVKNCIFRDELAGAIDAINGIVGTYSYNDYSGCTNEGGTGSITTDPLFVDANNGNFNLRQGSPCIGTGTLI